MRIRQEIKIKFLSAAMVVLLIFSGINVLQIIETIIKEEIFGYIRRDWI